MDLPIDWNIFPLPPNKKFPPLLKEWESTKYPQEKLKEHIGKSNFALGTGDISGGIIVFDLDFRKGRKKEGFSVIFKEIEKKFPHLINTSIISTPNGFHIYYELKGEEYRNTSLENIGYTKSLKSFTPQNQTKFANYLKGLDTRANGGYVVIPQSVINNKEYKVLND